jgi:leucyl/phenylalanyl-tRNA--protein transferase
MSKVIFPDTDLANKDGLLAIGGNLLPETLIQAYERGIFPWFSEDEPILWWTPDPRFVLFPGDIRESKSMRQFANRTTLKCTVNKSFEEVIANCGSIERPNQDGTWINDQMKRSYIQLHQMGIAHSIEVWEKELLVGGLYGLNIKQVFYGESMFSKVSNASKYAFIKLMKVFQDVNLKLIDCQIKTSHLESLGGTEIPRNRFEELIKLNNSKGEEMDWEKIKALMEC